MPNDFKLTGYFAGALFSGQELYGNWALANEINEVSRGLIQMDLPQDLATQETGDGEGTRSADYLGMIHRDFVFANMNGPELDSGTVAEYVVASMLGMPRVQFRSDFRNVGDVHTEFPAQITVRRTTAVPYNLMLGHDESATVYAHSMSLLKNSGTPGDFLRRLALSAVGGIKLAFAQTKTARPDEYASWHRMLARNLKLDPKALADILEEKKRRHLDDSYRQACKKFLAMNFE